MPLSTPVEHCPRGWITAPGGGGVRSCRHRSWRGPGCGVGQVVAETCDTGLGRRSLWALVTEELAAQGKPATMKGQHATHATQADTTGLAAAAVVLAAVTFTAGAPIASAATHTVQIPSGQNLFVTQNLGNVNVGDTITWQNNDAHNVVSANIPAGATPFASPIMSGAAATFSVTVTVPGNYRYLCTLHSSATAANAAPQSTSAMVGQFTVVAAPAPVPTVEPTVDAHGDACSDPCSNPGCDAPHDKRRLRPGVVLSPEPGKHQPWRLDHLAEQRHPRRRIGRHPGRRDTFRVAVPLR